MNQSKHSLRIVPMTRSQMAFALGLRGGLFHTRSPNRRIDSANSAENGIAIMQQALISLLATHRLSQLLPPPHRRRMRRHIEVNKSTAVMLYDDQHIQDAERAGHGDKKITGDDTSSMVAKKG
jgi:hypothetical protein